MDAVQLVAAQNTGCKALFQLKDRGLRRRTGRAGKGQLFVQLLCELHDLFRTVERIPGHRAQLGDQPHRVGEAAPGTLGRLVDHRFQLLRCLQAVVHSIKPARMETRLSDRSTAFLRP